MISLLSKLFQTHFSHLCLPYLEYPVYQPALKAIKYSYGYTTLQVNQQRRLELDLLHSPPLPHLIAGTHAFRFSAAYLFLCLSTLLTSANNKIPREGPVGVSIH